MAFWQRKGKAGGVYVYVWRDGKQVPLPRKDTRHLDRENDTNIDYWVEIWAKQHENPRLSYASHVADNELQRHIDDFCTFQEGRRKTDITVGQHRRYLTRDIVPFFIGRGLTSPIDWPSASWDLHDHLLAAGRSPDQIKAAQNALVLFWRWLGKARIHPLQALSLPLLPPILVRDAYSPSERPLTPEEVLAWVRTCEDRELRLIALLGYFFSLRPQEIVALRPKDFQAGSGAAFTEAAKALRSCGLYDRLVVTVDKQRDLKGKLIRGAKSNSDGTVGCFNEEAARLVVKEIKGAPELDYLLSRVLPDRYFKRWRSLGIPYTDTKDLRRTSLYWLGHYGGMDFGVLKSHARHKRSDTTMLYLRRPGERPAASGELDLDA